MSIKCKVCRVDFETEKAMNMHMKEIRNLREVL